MSDSYSFCNLNAFEFWLVIRIYTAASIPLILAAYYILKNKVSYSTSRLLIWSFIIVAIGWEIWLTYAIAGGLPVNERRSIALSCAIPQNLNWLLNSLADVLIIWVGIFLVKRLNMREHYKICMKLISTNILNIKQHVKMMMCEKMAHI